MAPFEVHVHARDLAAFRRRVVYHFKRYPKAEYMEAIFVRLDGRHYHIESFHKLWIQVRTRYRIKSSELQMQELRNQAATLGLRVGTIHTHTICDTAPSTGDLTGSVEDGEPIMGICEVTDKGSRIATKIDFWLPQLPGKIKQIQK